MGLIDRWRRTMSIMKLTASSGREVSASIRNSSKTRFRWSKKPRSMQLISIADQISSNFWLLLLRSHRSRSLAKKRKGWIDWLRISYRKSVMRHHLHTRKEMDHRLRIKTKEVSKKLQIENQWPRVNSRKYWEMAWNGTKTTKNNYYLQCWSS